MKYIFALTAQIVSVITILFVAYALVSILRGLVRRNFKVQKIVVPCLLYCGWLIALLMIFSLVACALFFAGNFVLGIFPVSWFWQLCAVVGLFLTSALIAAGVTVVLWEAYVSLQ